MEKVVIVYVDTLEPVKGLEPFDDRDEALDFIFERCSNPDLYDAITINNQGQNNGRKENI